ncbi:MAG: hypothetical protein AAF530_03795 [Pseudomonadota bacterium]
MTLVIFDLKSIPENSNLVADAPGQPAARSSDKAGGPLTYRLANFNASTQKGEPRFNNRMKKTIWARWTADRNAKVILHTIGSDFDTALAVHTGKKVNKLKKIAFNDNINIPSISRNHSLVEFNAKKGTQYKIQMGSKSGDEGIVLLTGSMVPKAGGLSVFLAQVDGTNYSGRNYTCVISDVEDNNCGDPTFVLHNSSKKKITVTADHSLGPNIDSPNAITLNPGAVATITYAFRSGFDTLTNRSLSGEFMFTAKRGKKLINEVHLPALITVTEDLGASDSLSAVISPTVRAAQVNQPMAFEMAITNNGNQKAVGCHARPDRFVPTQVFWAQKKSKKKGGFGPINRVFSLKPGQTKNYLVWLAPMQSRAGDPTFAGSNQVRIDCANTKFLAFDLKNNFDITTRGSWIPAQLTANITSPKGDIIRVPKKKAASFTAVIKNKGKSKANLRVSPTYGAPFQDLDRYGMTVCKLTKKKGKCDLPPSFSVSFEAKKKSTHYIKVFVTAPANDPGFDQQERRVFVNVWQNKPNFDLPGTSSVIVASDSVAPRLR